MIMEQYIDIDQAKIVMLKGREKKSLLEFCNKNSITFPADLRFINKMLYICGYKALEHNDLAKLRLIKN